MKHQILTTILRESDSNAHTNMHNLLAAAGFGGSSALLAIMFGQVLTPTTSVAIPLESALGALVIVSGIIWWMGRKFQSIEDKLDVHAGSVKELHKRIDNLPCNDNQCNGVKENK